MKTLNGIGLSPWREPKGCGKAEIHAVWHIVGVCVSQGTRGGCVSVPLFLKRIAITSYLCEFGHRIYASQARRLFVFFHKNGNWKLEAKNSFSNQRTCEMH